MKCSMSADVLVGNNRIGRVYAKDVEFAFKPDVGEVVHLWHGEEIESLSWHTNGQLSVSLMPVQLGIDCDDETIGPDDVDFDCFIGTIREIGWAFTCWYSGNLPSKAFSNLCSAVKLHFPDEYDELRDILRKSQMTERIANDRAVH